MKQGGFLRRLAYEQRAELARTEPSCTQTTDQSSHLGDIPLPCGSCTKEGLPNPKLLPQQVKLISVATMLRSIPLVVVDGILDIVWDNLVVCLETRQYMSLVLINKSFKSAVYRRRKWLMIAQAAHLQGSGYPDEKCDLIRDPLSNPYNSPLAVLAQFILAARGYYMSDVQRIWTLIKKHS
ncbi:hypothetical protein DFJ77DRAFT_354566 [Powellomyces hirtus]|nr:hypothetical protein DFJ77DRAFT_354566 [Powellomyces hirtus]